MGSGSIDAVRPQDGGILGTLGDSGAGTYAEQLSYQDCTTMAGKPSGAVCGAGNVRDGSLYRRHLNESQRAMIAGKIANMKVGHPEANSANLQNSVSSAATLMNVSERTVHHAKSVQEHGTRELVKAVEDGKIRRFGRHGYPLPDRVPGPDTLVIIRSWSWWDLKIAIAKLDEK